MNQKGVIVNGLVLKSADHGENDKLVTALTLEKGKIIFSAKGVKSLKNKNGPSCRPFTYSEFVLNERNGFYTLSEGSAKTVFKGIDSDLEGIYLAYYVTEVCDYICMDGAVEEDVLRLALNTLYAISEKIKPYDLIKTVFETSVLNCLGTLPPVNGCHECGGKPLYMSVFDGTVLCQECMAKHNAPGYEVLTENAVLFFGYEEKCDKKRIFAVSEPDECAKKIAETYLQKSVAHSFVTLKQYKALKDF